MDFEEAWGSVVALREAVAGGFVKPGRDELPLLALAAEIDRLRQSQGVLLVDTRGMVVEISGCTFENAPKG